MGEIFLNKVKYIEKDKSRKNRKSQHPSTDRAEP